MSTKRKVVAEILKKLIGFDYNKPLKTKKDVKDFFEWLLVVRDVSFHPDDPFSNYVNRNSRRNTFTKKEIPALDKRMEEAFEIMGDKDEDGIYALAMEVNEEVNGKLQKGGRIYGKHKRKEEPARKSENLKDKKNKNIIGKHLDQVIPEGHKWGYTYVFIIDKNDDKAFLCHVEDLKGIVKYTLNINKGKPYSEASNFIMDHKDDTEGIRKHLIKEGILNESDKLKRIFGIGGKVNRLVTCCEDGGELTVGSVRQYFDDMDTTALPAEAVSLIEEIRNHPASSDFDIHNETFVDLEKLLKGKVKKKQVVPPEPPATVAEIEVELPATDDRTSLQDQIEALKASLPYLKGADKKEVQEQIATLKDALKYLPETITKFKPGDLYSNDFDYDGMLKAGVDAKLSMGREYLANLNRSFASVNYHKESGILWELLRLLDKGDTTSAEKKMKEFNKACEEGLKGQMSLGGNVNIRKRGYKVGELVFVRSMGNHGLVGLVMSDKYKDEGELVQKIYYRGYMGDIIPTPVSDLDGIENGHLSDARNNGDLSAYKSIAKKLNIALENDYEAMMEDDDEEMKSGGGDDDWTNSNQEYLID